MKQSIPNRILGGAALFLSVTTGMLNAQTYSHLTIQHPDWVQAPGALVRPDCVHMVASGAKVEAAADGRAGEDVTLHGQLIAHYDPCPEQAISTRHLMQDPGPTGNGWVEASQWDTSLASGDNLSWLYGYWTVPAAPATDGGLIYLFNGVEPTGGGWIMQPVLQYGDNGTFGGDNWTLASWLVHNNSDFFVSTPIDVNAGDELAGALFETGISGSTLSYYISGADQTSNQSSNLSVETWGLHWIWAYAGVLEVYRVSSCSQLPGGSIGSDEFVKTHVYHKYPGAELLTNKFYKAEYNYGGPSCGFNVDVSGGSSTLYY